MDSSTVEGPNKGANPDEQAYVYRGSEGNVPFVVIPEGEGWAVRIEGFPDPAIVHEEPWSSPDDARDAAAEAIRAMQVLERMQREELERSS